MRPRGIGKLAVVVAFVVVTLGACGDDADDPPIATMLECATVAFTPNSEDAASDVRATGVPCDEAESFVRRAGAVTSSGGPEEVDVDGYRCVRTGGQQDPLPRSSYECTDGSRKVTFVRS